MSNNDKKDFGGRFLDWVNADTDLPTLEELEQAHHHDDAHEEHDSHTEAVAESQQIPAAEKVQDEALHDGPNEDAAAENESQSSSVIPETAEDDLRTGDEVTDEEDGLDALIDTADVHAAAGTGDADLEYPDPLVPGEVLNKDAERKASKELKEKAGASKTLYGMISGLFAAIIIAILIATVSYLPSFGGAENPTINEVYDKYVNEGVEDTGAVNLVAGMILDYRAFDTLGESLMLFTATMGVVMLIRNAPGSKKTDKSDKEGRK